jgi:hypothetical protein
MHTPAHLAYLRGTATLKTVLSYWGCDIGLAELDRALPARRKTQVAPQELVSAARALGFDAQLRMSVSIDRLFDEVSCGFPAIVQLALPKPGMAARGEVFRKRRSRPSYAVIWASDTDNVYFQDCCLRMSFLHRDDFIAGWRAGFEDVVSRMAIMIKGGKPPPFYAPVSSPFTSLRCDEARPVDIVAVQFAKQSRPDCFLREADDAGIGGSGAFILLRKSMAGRLAGFEVGSRKHEDAIDAIDALIAAIVSQGVSGPTVPYSATQTILMAAAKADFGLSAGGLRRTGELLSPGHSALIIFVQNLQKQRLKNVAERHDGKVVSHKLVPKAAVTKVIAAIERLPAIRPPPAAEQSVFSVFPG